MVTYGIISDSSDFLWLLNNVRLSRKCTFAIASSISFNGYLRFVKYIFKSFKRLFNVVSIYIYMMFVKLYFRTSDIYLISLVSLDPSGFHLRTK